MALKWTGILVAVIAVTLTVTANLLNTADRTVLPIVNLIAVCSAVGASVIAIVAELYVRIDAKLTKLQNLVVARFDQVDAETGDRNTGFVEGYLLSRGPDASVVPMPQRPGRRATE